MPQISRTCAPISPNSIFKHKVELQLAGWTNERTLGGVADITAALIGCGQVALQRGDTAWLDRHRWFGDACERLLADQSAVPLDG